MGGIRLTVAIRRFEEKDIPYKVKWINDEKNNKYLHYDLPLQEDKTLFWFKSLKERTDRVDYTITYNDEPAGIIGLLNIDEKNSNAEYYICIGNEKFKGKGIAKVATDFLLKKSIQKFGLGTVYLYTEVENIRAQKLFEKSGFKKRKLIKKHLFYEGKYIDRYLYVINLEEYLQSESEI